nr:hypothetical protein [Gloeotrichia echinulata DEX184]
MTENSANATIKTETTGLELSPDASENIAVLPRSAWKSQLTYLKVLLKAKQSLDKSETLNSDNS